MNEIKKCKNNLNKYCSIYRFHINLDQLRYHVTALKDITQMYSYIPEIINRRIQIFKAKMLKMLTDVASLLRTFWAPFFT
ncbi:hypothetical protein Avbf_02732 [Armadillidium vulgare]|nr:hypothetical protein Avbf_02732 [Armadillidium vulgare]